MMVIIGYYLHIRVGKFMDLVPATNHSLPVNCSIITISLSATFLRMIPNDPDPSRSTSLTFVEKMRPATGVDLAEVDAKGESHLVRFQMAKCIRWQL